MARIKARPLAGRHQQHQFVPVGAQRRFLFGAGAPQDRPADPARRDRHFARAFNRHPQHPRKLASHGGVRPLQATQAAQRGKGEIGRFLRQAGGVDRDSFQFYAEAGEVGFGAGGRVGAQREFQKAAGVAFGAAGIDRHLLAETRSQLPQTEACEFLRPFQQFSFGAGRGNPLTHPARPEFPGAGRPAGPDHPTVCFRNR